MLNLVNKVIFSTSREPSLRVRSFLKDIISLAPWLVKVNRGKLTFKDLVDITISEKSTTFVIIGEKNGNPSIMRIYDVSDYLIKNAVLHAYTLFIKGVTLAREANRPSSPGYVDDAIIEGSLPPDEEHRNLTFALIKMFGSSIIPNAESSNVLKIQIKGYPNSGWMLNFKKSGSNEYVGPRIFIGKVKKVGEYMSVSESESDGKEGGN
ncbi:Brix [Fervidicoccus fontis Kam940]|uniref:Probable Brix domain-containing ribosomal biogenesis protein n=1 Tax=Fervidicoccus fontis (strain DSM 19380 / JCM 18336 / VKM B-2539 / Kam940) TaxID=1163730 RepID=I0A2X2_FERFK|nr:Brix [Fervidicoccus fontis Kam940]